MSAGESTPAPNSDECSSYDEDTDDIAFDTHEVDCGPCIEAFSLDIEEEYS